LWVNLPHHLGITPLPASGVQLFLVDGGGFRITLAVNGASGHCAAGTRAGRVKRRSESGHGNSRHHGRGGDFILKNHWLLDINTDDIYDFCAGLDTAPVHRVITAISPFSKTAVIVFDFEIGLKRADYNRVAAFLISDNTPPNFSIIPPL